MKEHGILFSSPMVRAILEGRKTQTRRIAKFHEEMGSPLSVGLGNPAVEGKGGILDAGPEVFAAWFEECHVKPPHGPVGRRLWVRETWRARPSDYDPEGVVIEYAADGSRTFHCDEVPDEWEMPVDPQRWRPSIHMPRWASRITLEVTGVRVERVQSITEEDARAEGVDWAAPLPFKVDRRRKFVDDREDPREVGYGSGSFARQNFQALWRETYGDASWDGNDWVWVYTFRRIGHGQ